MKKPIQIAIKYTAGGLLAFLVVALLGALFLDSGSSVGAGVAAAVFVCMLFASTNAAYEQGKKDAVGGSQDQ